MGRGLHLPALLARPRRTGISPLYTYENFELSDGSTLSHNVPSGNLVLSSNDLGWEPKDGRSPTVRYFNSLGLRHGDFRGTFGAGNQGSFGSIRLEHHWLNNSYILAGPSGLTGVFQRRTDGGFTPPTEFDATLTQLPDDTFTLFFADSGETWTFNSDGDLEQTRQDDGYTVDVTWGPDGIATLADSAGHSATAGYDRYDRLHTLTDQARAVYTYDYDSNDRLITYTNPTGGQTRCTYDTSNRLTRIDLPDRTALKVAYLGTSAYPTTITPVNAVGVDQIATRYDGDLDWVSSERTGTPRTVYFFDPNTLIVDLIQTGSDAAIATSGSIPALNGQFTRGDAALTVDVSAAQVPDGIQLTELEVDRVEVDSVGAEPCDETTCPSRARETLSYDPTFDPEGAYEYQVNTVDGDNERTDGPLWRFSIDRTGPTSSATNIQAFFEDQTDETTVAWEAGTSPNLPDATPGAPIVRYEVRSQVDVGGWTAWQPAVQPQLLLAGTRDGSTIDIEIRSQDSAGNVGVTTAATLRAVSQEPEEELPPVDPLTREQADECPSYQEAMRSTDPDASYMCIFPEEPEMFAPFSHDDYHWDFAWLGYYGDKRYPYPIGQVSIQARTSLLQGSLSVDEMSLKATGGVPIRPDLRINCRYYSNDASCRDSEVESIRYTTARIYNRDIIKHAWGRRYRHHFNFYWRALGFRNPTSTTGKWHAFPVPKSDIFVCRKFRYECVFQ